MADSPAAALTPVQRLLAAERLDITYLCVYAALTGLITLSLPLGVQAVIGSEGSGEVSTSLVVLIGFIVAGTLLAGGLQVMQIYLAEVVQQRLYARLALDFAVRLPRVRTEALHIFDGALTQRNQDNDKSIRQRLQRCWTLARRELLHQPDDESRVAEYLAALDLAFSQGVI